MPFARLPSWLLCIIGTLFWRAPRVRNVLWPEIKRRWPAMFLTTWRSCVIVKTENRMFNWIKRFFSNPPAAGVFIGPGFDPLRPRAGKSAVSKVIDSGIAACGAQPGDIVEIDQNGMARVVGRRPCLAGDEQNPSEHAIRAKLMQLYGEDVPILSDVKRGGTVVVFRNHSAA